MNEVTRIHLGRTTYEIDVEAKKDLEKYIMAIKKSLDDAEIMDDIELRMTEILIDRGVEKNGVITSVDVAAIRAQLGEPRDFADSDDAAAEDWRDNLFTRGKDDRQSNKYRKYYRDTDNGILGGVAAGLSAYTGWDLTLVRAAFVLAVVLSVGWAVLAYVIIWIVLPAARTTAEKLEMRGEPVTLESLSNSDFAKKSRDNAEAFVDNVKEKVDDIKTKVKKGKGSAYEAKDDAKTYAADIKADVRDEVRAQREDKREARREYREETRGSYVSPIAAIFGVLLHCFGFITLVGTFTFGAIAIVTLLQNPFSHEVWLWLSVGAAVIAGLTMVGFFMSAGQALMYRHKRRNIASEIAGTLGSTIMFSFIASMFMGVWLWNIPRDYHLPADLTHNIQRFDNGVCQINVSWSGVEVLRKCKTD